MIATSRAVLVAVALAPLAAGCGVSFDDIRSAAREGDLERAVRLAERTGWRWHAAALGTLERLAAEPLHLPALREALDAPPASAVPLLETWAEGGGGSDPATRAFAQARLAEIDGGWDDELTAALESPEGAVRAEAIRGLGARLSTARRIALLEDPFPPAVAAAARSLVRHGGPEGLDAEFLPAVRRIAPHQPDPAVTALLLGLLDPIDDENRATLVAALGASAPAVRTAAAVRLAAVPGARDFGPLAEILAAAPSPVQLALAVELDRLGDPEPLERIAEILLDPASPADALRAGLLRVLPEADRPEELLLRAFEAGGDQTRIAACELLGGTGDPGDRCRGFLQRLALQSPAASVALAATEVLAEAGDPAARDWLRFFALNEDPAVRRRVMTMAATRGFDPELLSVGLGDPDPGVAAAAAAAALRAPADAR
jgi:hypothetical protein